MKGIDRIKMKYEIDLLLFYLVLRLSPFSNPVSFF
jgi:hypothetical protein